MPITTKHLSFCDWCGHFHSSFSQSFTKWFCCLSPKVFANTTGDRRTENCSETHSGRDQTCFCELFSATQSLSLKRSQKRLLHHIRMGGWTCRNLPSSVWSLSHTRASGWITATLRAIPSKQVSNYFEPKPYLIWSCFLIHHLRNPSCVTSQFQNKLGDLVLLKEKKLNKIMQRNWLICRHDYTEFVTL